MNGAIAIVVAAGRGTRMGQAATTPKQYRHLGGRAILAWAVEPFLRSDRIEAVLPVLHSEDFALFAEHVPGDPKLLAPVSGGPSRQESVHRGLEALAERAPEHVLVHDGVRPFVSPGLVARVLDALADADGALPALPVTDTLKAVGPDGRVTRTVFRDSLRSVQTPQGFRFPALLDAHRAAASAGLTGLTDDAAVAEEAGLGVMTVPGDPENVKITVAADLAGAERRFGDGARLEVRVGQGFDVHAFGDGDQLMLGGIAMPFSRGLAGHSDADVALHALTDAVLGALCDGDIGRHFPPGDPEWKGASSDRFLRFAAERVRGRGGMIDHLDVTLVCEAPKIGPLSEAMRRRIAEIAGIAVDRVSVKATTTERLGFTGRGEGIAALASATIRVPAQT